MDRLDHVDIARTLFNGYDPRVLLETAAVVRELAADEPELFEAVLGNRPDPNSRDSWFWTDWPAFGLLCMLLYAPPGVTLREGAPVDAFETLRLKKLYALPPGMGRLTRLRHLEIEDSTLDTLPEDIGELEALETLDVGARLLSLPESVGWLSRLTELRLRGNLLTELPSSIGGLRALRTLYLDSNPLEALPHEVGELQALESLFLGDTWLSTLPPALYRCTELREIDALGVYGGPRLTSMPEGISALTKLETLQLNIDELPADFKDLNISALKLSGRFETLPPAVAALPNLRHLRLGGRDRPIAGLETLQQVTHLTLYSLGWRTLPESLQALTQLETLDVSRNPLTELPAWLADLPNLTRLITGWVEVSDKDRRRLERRSQGRLEIKR